MFLPVLLLSLFNLAFCLQCTDNCFLNSSLSDQFVLPSNCSYVSASRCSVKILFWYNRGNYIVTFFGESSNDNNVVENSHFIMIETAMYKFFSYDIHHVCRESDDCARIFAEETIKQMIQRSYNILNIYSDLQRLLLEKSTLSENLACFDMNDAVRQCTVPGTPGSCQIVDDIIRHKFHRRSCLHSAQESASVNIYDSGSFALMTVKCNRMLCNGPLTIAAVKKVLRHHNVTDVDDRLPGNSSQILFTRYLFIVTIFLSFRNK